MADHFNTPYKYAVSTRMTPGSAMMVVSGHHTLTEARKAAREYRNRKDLTWQDVRIERADGSLVAYAGPCR